MKSHTPGGHGSMSNTMGTRTSTRDGKMQGNIFMAGAQNQRFNMPRTSERKTRARNQQLEMTGNLQSMGGGIANAGFYNNTIDYNDSSVADQRAYNERS